MTFLRIITCEFSRKHGRIQVWLLETTSTGYGKNNVVCSIDISRNTRNIAQTTPKTKCPCAHHSCPHLRLRAPPICPPD